MEGIKNPQDISRADSPEKRYKSNFVKVTLYREHGGPDGPIETTYNRWGIEEILIPVNQKKSDPIVAYQIGNGPVVPVNKNN